MTVIRKYLTAPFITSSSTAPNTSLSNGLQNIRQTSISVPDITITVRKICLAADYTSYHFSVQDTAETAALPTLLTIMVSTIPIKAFNNCSTMIGMSNAHNVFFEKRRCCQSILDELYNLFF